MMVSLRKGSFCDEADFTFSRPPLTKAYTKGLSLHRPSSELHKYVAFRKL